VCAIDFSAHSREALALGLRLSSGPVHAVHVLDMPHYVHPRMLGFLGSESARPITEIARERAEQRLRELVAEVDAVGDRVVPLVLVGVPGDTLLRFAQEHTADLLVIGTQGEAPLSRRLLGSVANRVIRGARCPLITVPPRGVPQGDRDKRILVATDFSLASEEALALACALARAEGADLDVLHVAASPLLVPPDLAVTADPFVSPTPPVGDALTWLDLTQKAAREEMDRLEALAERRGICITRARVEVGNPAARVLEVLEREPYRMVAVGTHGRRGLSHLMLGSVAESITHHAEVPVLIVHRPNEGA
jgi:nucleotide-binding universal stress UspA family protein